MPRIKEILQNSSASSQLKISDYIISVNDVSCLDKPLEEVIDLIRGATGTTVKITVADTKAGTNPREFVLVRGNIQSE
jgi:C-terminal processing protease CtpA/Prc